MDSIKIEVSVKLDLSEECKKFVSSLVINALAPAASATKPAAAKPAAPAAPATKPAEAPAAQEAPAASEVSIDDVRKLLATKVATHRVEIKDKLNELCAPSVTKLDPAKYGVMYDYLKSLS